MKKTIEVNRRAFPDIEIAVGGQIAENLDSSPMNFGVTGGHI